MPKASKNRALLKPNRVPELLGDQPLKAIIVGHNPSETSYQHGHYYAHKSNRMWPILKKAGLADETIRGAEDDARMLELGIGFLDVGSGHPGTYSQRFSSTDFANWATPFYDRLANHASRAATHAHQSIATCQAGPRCACGEPKVVCFAGKRQYLELVNLDKAPLDRIKTVEFGRQVIRPANFPFASSLIWVTTTTSGAARMTNQAREASWMELGDVIKGMR